MPRKKNPLDPHTPVSSKPTPPGLLKKPKNPIAAVNLAARDARKALRPERVKRMKQQGY